MVRKQMAGMLRGLEKTATHQKQRSDSSEGRSASEARSALTRQKKVNKVVMEMFSPAKNRQAKEHMCVQILLTISAFTV